MWLVWFWFSTHSATIFAVRCDSCGVTNFAPLIFNRKCNNCRGLQYSTICTYALTSILSVFCLWSMLQLFSCSQVWQPSLSSFPVFSSLWSPCFTISCRNRLFPFVTGFSLIYYKTEQGETKSSCFVLALETENILKTELFETGDDVMIVMWFHCPGLLRS